MFENTVLNEVMSDYHKSSFSFSTSVTPAQTAKLVQYMVKSNKHELQTNHFRRPGSSSSPHVKFKELTHSITHGGSLKTFGDLFHSHPN